MKTWIKTSKQLPTEEDADKYGAIIGRGYGIGSARELPWQDVVSKSHFYIYWVPMPRFPDEKIN